MYGEGQDGANGGVYGVHRGEFSKMTIRVLKWSGRRTYREEGGQDNTLPPSKKKKNTTPSYYTTFFIKKHKKFYKKIIDNFYKNMI